MRLIALLMIFAAITFATARAAAPGAYAAPAAGAAVDCVKLCDDDSLCVGWTYEAGACGLWASVPSNVTSHFTLSNRAPGVARRIQVAEPQSAAPQEQPTYQPAAAALLGGDTPAEDLRPRFGGN